MSPPPVRLRNSISATRRGSTHFAPLATAVSSFSGAVLVRIGSSSFHRFDASVALKPLPTCPEGTSLPPTCSPSTSAPIARLETVEVTKPAITNSPRSVALILTQLLLRPDW